MPSEKLVAETATPGFNQSIPGKIMTPDSVQTRIGTLEFVDGVPTTATTQIVYDHLDFLRGVEVFLNFIPAASLEGLRLGQIERGATTCNQLLLFDQLMDSNPLFLTGNTDTVYCLAYARMKKILTEAAAVGTVTARALAMRPRSEEAYYYPGSAWFNTMPGGNHQFLSQPGVRDLDMRVLFHYFYTGITPAMVAKMVGRGSQYITATIDSQGKALDGGKTYKIHLPPDVPMKDFWSFTLYDNQTRSMLQTDQRYPSVNSTDKGIMTNPDGSVDVWFGPTVPQGVNPANWAQTIPGKGWNVIFRLYGPLEPWFDKTWRPGEFELVK